MDPIPYLIVFLGSGIGGALRHGVNQFIADGLGIKSFPLGILLINISGSLLLGFLEGYFAFNGELLSIGDCF